MKSLQLTKIAKMKPIIVHENVLFVSKEHKQAFGQRPKLIPIYQIYNICFIANLNVSHFYNNFVIIISTSILSNNCFSTFAYLHKNYVHNEED